MSATLKTKQQFIELRANNESYEKIAKKLKVSKTTFIAWAKDSELDIENLRAITFEALQEQYKVGQQHRLQMWSEQLEMMRTELKTRGLGDIQTTKLVESYGCSTNYSSILQKTLTVRTDYSVNCVCKVPRNKCVSKISSIRLWSLLPPY